MSDGPIKAWRDSWKPPKTSSSNAERACFKNLLAAKAYCGRRPKLAFDDPTKVTCSDCLAALRADREATS